MELVRLAELVSTIEGNVTAQIGRMTSIVTAVDHKVRVLERANSGIGGVVNTCLGRTVTVRKVNW
jgi:hypothetical protein